ncbi:hypothetical protein FPOAC2_07111 [Fusarium poae]
MFRTNTPNQNRVSRSNASKCLHTANRIERVAETSIIGVETVLQGTCPFYLWTPRTGPASAQEASFIRKSTEQQQEIVQE